MVPLDRSRRAQRPLAIVHVISDLAAAMGGPPRACLGMAAATAARGHRVEIHTTDWKDAGPPATAAGVAVHRHKVDLGGPWPVSRALARALDAAVREADVVHLHSLYLFHDWAAARACRRHGVPFVLRPHGTFDPFVRARRRLAKAVLDRAFQARVTAAAAAIHCTSAAERDHVLAAAPGAAVAVVPLGLDDDAFRPLPPRGGFRARHPETGDRRIVLFLGRLAEKKGLDLLVPAFAAARRDHGDLHLVLAGPDHGMAQALDGPIAAAGIAGAVTRTGMVEGEAKRRLLADADLFVLPSYGENFGIAVAEALAAGVPVAVSDRVGIAPDLAAAGAALVAPATVEGTAAMLRRIAGDPAAAAAMGRRGRDLARRRYAWPAIAPALEALYRGVIGSR